MKLRVCAVSYLNTRPFLYGLGQVFSEEEISITTKIPSECAVDFKEGLSDLALVPAGALLELGNPEKLHDWCIGAEGKVDSVFVCSHQPVSQIQYLVQDRHSRTSNLLASLLLKRYWNSSAEIILPQEDAWKNPAPETAYVIIGDKAVKAKEDFPFVYDLAEEWKQYSGLPFVFAVWVYRNLTPEILHKVHKAFEIGMQNLPLVAEYSGPDFGLEAGQALDYFTRSLSYRLDNPKKQALQKFLAEGASIQLPLLDFKA
jgi:chorismate dehydratase